MTFQYASDLHLEFPENREWLRTHPLQAVAPVLLLAGDILPFRMLEAFKDLISWLADGFEQVIWIPGNHEYYGSDISQRSGTVDEAILPNVRLVNDRAVHLGAVRILCTTLWSPIAQLNEAHIRRNVNDFHRIKQDGKQLHPAHVTRLHQASLAWLKEALATPHLGSTVVMTHHVPTLRHYPLQYLGSPLNQAFAVELEELITASGAEAWIYGHHHNNTSPFTMGTTRMLTNQLGYVQLGEHQGFNPGAVFHTSQP
jgi:predicted phosphohydrolase